MHTENTLKLQKSHPEMHLRNGKFETGSSVSKNSEKRFFIRSNV